MSIYGKHLPQYIFFGRLLKDDRLHILIGAYHSVTPITHDILPPIDTIFFLSELMHVFLIKANNTQSKICNTYVVYTCYLVEHILNANC